MATYDFEGMFGDRYSTEQAINSAMFNEAMSFGQLDRSKYAPMTASTYGQAYMGGAGIGGLLGGVHPMMKRQNLLDEIKKKYPDPRTPEELNELAEELSKNGFGDLAMQVRQVSMEMEKNEATKAYNAASLLKPTADDWKKIGRTLEGSVLNTDVIDAYLGIVEPQLVAYDDSTYKGGKDNFNSRRKSRLDEVRNLIQQFADSYQGGFNKTQIEEAIGDDSALTEKFIEWIGTHGNRDVADNLLTAMGRIDTEKDTTTTGVEAGSEANQGAGQAVEVNDTNFPITSKWTNKIALAQKERLDRLVDEGRILQGDDLKLHEELKRRFPPKVAMATPLTVDSWWTPLGGSY